MRLAALSLYLIFTSVRSVHAAPEPSRTVAALSPAASAPSDPGVNYPFTSYVPGCTNLGGGSFSFITASNADTICGKGWNPGSVSRVIHYTGSYQPNGNSYLAVYGWTRNPLIEYYIVESYGSYNPSSPGQMMGSVTCDGGNYSILKTTRVNQPSIDGTQTFQQFWSVRNPKRNPGGTISGTITFACHAQAWAKVGMNLGSSMNYQYVVIEAYFSSINSTLTVS